MYWFYYKDLGIGGAETLVYRLANYFSQTVGAVIVSETVEDFYEQNANENLKLMKYKRAGALSMLLQAKTEDVVMTFYLRDFLRLKFISVICGRKAKVVMYILHPMILDVQSIDRFPYVKKFIKKIIRMILIRDYKNHKILFMDECSIRYIGDAYYCKNILAEKAVFRLPYEIKEVEKELIKNKTESRKDKFNILAIARATFPFKGYLLGLVERFRDITEKYRNVSLTIISYGPDFRRLEDIIYQSPVSDHIDLIGKVPYNELDDYYKKAHVYIGMGSTLIEAAQFGAVPLIAKSYEERLKIKNYFFCERPEIIGGLDDSDYIEGDYMIRKILDLTDEDYYRMAMRSRKVVVDMYDIKKVAGRMNKYLNCDSI